MMLFVGEDCPHCAELEEELENQNLYQELDIQSYEIYHNESNLELYFEISQQLGYTNGGVPLLVDENKFVEGTTPILDYLNMEIDSEQNANTISLEDSNHLNEIVENLIKEKEDKDNGEISTAITFGSPDIFSLIMAVLFLVVIIGGLYRICHKKK